MEGYSENLKPSTPYKLTKLTLPYNLEDDQEDSYPSDCESGISGSQKSDNNSPVMIRMDEGDKICEFIKKQLVSSLSSDGFSAQVEAISRKDYSEIMSRVKYQSFCLYSKGIEIRRKGNANVKYAWYGGASKNELTSIVSHGFSFPPNTSGVYGRHLSPTDHPLESVQYSSADENGLRHMLLCRVILGNTEVIHPGSGQYTPSSEEFDSGVDNLVSPKKYIIWNGKMNTHILPEFLVSFRTSSYCSSCRETNKISTSPRVPKSDWMSLPSLIDHLSKFLPCEAIKLISQHHNDYRKRKITRHEIIQLVRHIAGDELLIMIIKKAKKYF